ncbi:hypothetical protein JCM6882_001221 [Rhodosporidiobolus microsporus]
MVEPTSASAYADPRPAPGPPTLAPAAPTTTASSSSTSDAHPHPPKASSSSPTCYIHYGTRSVKARIDREVPLHEIIAQLAASSQLAVAEPAALFALREKDSGQLVTEENLTAMLEKGNVFNLCSSPTIEAVEMVEKLHSTESNVVKLATFSLRTLIQERAFLAEFIARGGLEALQDVIRRTGGNTLAYSLLSLQNLCELDEAGWTGLERSFVARIVEIIATEPLINISRPSTAILRRIASQPAQPPFDLSSPSLTNSPSGAHPSANPNPEIASGFAAVFACILAQPDFLPTLVNERLASGDVAVVNSTLGLLDTLVRGSVEEGDLRLSEELEALDAWKTIGKLLTGSTGASLPLLLSLQSALVSVLHLLSRTHVDVPHYRHFDEIWIASGLEDEDEANRWRRLGFRTESPQFEFDATGLLGLKYLAKYATESQNEFAATLQDQLSRPEPRRCPLSTVSNTVLYLLALHFSLLDAPPSSSSSAPSSAAATASSLPAVTPNPYLFRLAELHALAAQFFLRMWGDSGASSVADYERVTNLTASQIAFVLGGGPTKTSGGGDDGGAAAGGGGAGGQGGQGGEKTWFKVRQEFLVAEYRVVRERQMREMEIEDDILGKGAVRNLRGRLYLESYEFLRAQRIACLHHGAWFQVVSSSTSSSSSSAFPSSSGAASGRKPVPTTGTGAGGERGARWRFYRLAPNRKALGWVERGAGEGREVPVGGLEELPERLDLALVTDVVPSGANALQRPRPSTNDSHAPAAPHHRTVSSLSQPQRGGVFSRSSTDTATPSHTHGASHSAPSPSLSFTLHTSDGPLITLLAPSQHTYSEWVDGLSLLLPSSHGTGGIATQETADYVQQLTDIGVKVKLLDLSGERVEVPKGGVEVRGVPRSTEFFYSDTL